MSIGGAGALALIWLRNSKPIRLAYLTRYKSETYRNTYAFYELWNYPAWESMHPELDLCSALQKEIVDSHLQLSQIVKSPTGRMHSQVQTVAPQVRLWQLGEGTVKIGNRTIDRVLQYDRLKLHPLVSATTFP